MWINKLETNKYDTKYIIYGSDKLIRRWQRWRWGYPHMMTDQIDQEMTKLERWDRHMMTDQIDKEVKRVEMWDRHIMMTGQVDNKVERLYMWDRHI